MDASFNGCVFICGESSSCDGADLIRSTKSLLLVNLSAVWPVRTHCEAVAIEPRGADKGALFRNIAGSYVFLFIFSEETTMNAFYLNQLGIAFARGVQIIGVREPSYIMPNPLPEHYYSTEIIDLTAQVKPNEGRNKANTRAKTILSNLLIDSFRNAVVYSTDFHKHCLERLFRKVTDAYTRTKKERSFPPSLTVTDLGKTSSKYETNRHKIWTSVCGLTKCPKCGSQVKVNRKTSMLYKANSMDNLFKDSPPRASARYQLDAPQLMITKSVLQPIVLQPSFSKSVFQAGARRPATSVIRKASSAKAGSQVMTVTRSDASEPRPMSSDSIPAGAVSRLKDSTEMRDGGAQQAIVAKIINVKENEPAVRRKPSIGFITNKRGALLRKMSSLPCIPTTYLVAEPGCEKPAFVKYPPVNGNHSDGVPEFTDDEDKETIHISRRPSPAISTCSTYIESE